MKKEIKIYTDSSVKKGVSTHHYRIVIDGKRQNRHTYCGNEQNQHKAEAYTVVKALQRADRKGLENFTLYTDSKITVDGVHKIIEANKNKIKLKKINDDYRYIAYLLKELNGKIEWKSRESYGIKKADSECRKLMNTRMNRVI